MNEFVEKRADMGLESIANAVHDLDAVLFVALVQMITVYIRKVIVRAIKSF